MVRQAPGRHGDSVGQGAAARAARERDFVGHDRRAAFGEMEGRILLAIGILARRTIDRNDDLVAALLLCAGRSQAPGRCYNIAGERPVTVRELATTIAHSLDRELPAGSIPLWLANFASDIFACVPGMKGERAPLTRSRVKFLTNSRIYDISRAKSELGYTPKVGLEDGMKLTAAWYYKHGYLDDSSRNWRTVR